MYLCKRRWGPGECIQFRCKRRETKRGRHVLLRKVSLRGLTREVCFRRCSMHTVSFGVRLEDENVTDDSNRLEAERIFEAP